MKLKHNKKRNTAFIYEALIKEATSALLKNNTEKREKIVKIIRKHFNQKSLLRRDLERPICEKIVTEAKFLKG